MITIKQVAKEAGVSKSTVSRYISQNGYVGKEAQEKIQAAIKKLDFVPNLSARTLKTKKTQLIGLLLPDISNPFFPMLAKGVEDYLQEQGYQILLGNIGHNSEREKEYLRIFAQNHVAGLITTHDFSEQSTYLSGPIVVVDRVGHDSKYGVFSNNAEGGQLAARVIVEAGAEKIAVVSGPNLNQSVHSRFAASIAYLTKQHKSFRKFYSEDYDFAVAQKEAKKILNDFPDLDSIIAPSDIHAIAFIHEILGRGKRVPEDVQVIGYDDILVSQFTYPALSTIHQPAYEMGWEAAKMIVKLVSNQPVSENLIELPVSYVSRETIRK